MKTILVPTDFSECAQQALNYAVALAKKFNSKVILMNAFHVNYSSPDMPVEFYAAELKNAEENATRKMKSLQTKIFKTHKLKCQTICEEGLAVQVILDQIKKSKPDLLVMGTKGASGLKKIFMGSNAASVIQDASCPVLAVPEKAKFKLPKSFVYATAYHKSDKTNLKFLLKLLKEFKSGFTFLHISDESLSVKEETLAIEKFRKEISSAFKYPKIKYELVFGKDIAGKLEDYIRTYGPDWLITSTRQRNLVEKVFNKSISKKIAFHSTIPLLTFHYSDKPVVLL